MVQVEVYVVACVPGGLEAKATWVLFQGELLANQRGKRHVGQVLCISTPIGINEALKRIIGF